jgi:hypothetical protein
MKLITDITTDIPVGKMKDGDIAIVTQWQHGFDYAGEIVQRYKDYLIRVGKPASEGWDDIFKRNYNFLYNKSCMVRILPSGTVLEIE